MKKAIGLLVFTAVVLRAEVALLLATVVAQLWWSGAVTIPDVVQAGLISGLPSIGEHILRPHNLSQSY